MTTTKNMSSLFALIEGAVLDGSGGDWCTVSKAEQLAALVVALRPRTIVELGVFLGGSLIPLALAQQSYAFPAREVTWAVDPWSASASIEGQTMDNAAWWGKLNHDQICDRFMARIRRYDLGDIVRVVRAKSDDVDPPERIDLLHIDGNHGEQARRDVERFAPNVSHGGILILDDLDWEGGAVRAGHELALSMGFSDMNPLGTGVVMRRLSMPSSPAQLQGLH